MRTSVILALAAACALAACEKKSSLYLEPGRAVEPAKAPAPSAAPAAAPAPPPDLQKASAPAPPNG